MKLYNITFDLKDDRQLLEPCIPKSAADDEDKTIPRVCFTDSVEHCFQAIPGDSRNACKYAEFLIRSIEINVEECVSPQELFDKKLVPDALENQEYWVLHPVFCDVYKCVLLDFDHEFAIAWSCINKDDCIRIISSNSDWVGDTSGTSEDIYHRFCRWTQETKNWNAEDKVWDALVMLPWAQLSKFLNVDYKVVEEY